MPSPHAIFIDVLVAICADPEWGTSHYPSRIHFAHDTVERARMHLGIRVLEGYEYKPSRTQALDEILQGSPDGETPQAEPEVWF